MATPSPGALDFMKLLQKCGDQVQDSRRDDLRKSKVRLLAFLSAQDDMVEPAPRVFVTGKVTNKEKLMGRESPTFDLEGAKIFGKPSKYWMGNGSCASPRAESRRRTSVTWTRPTASL